jgi:hypothetical protein
LLALQLLHYNTTPSHPAVAAPPLPSVGTAAEARCLGADTNAAALLLLLLTPSAETAETGQATTPLQTIQLLLLLTPGT